MLICLLASLSDYCFLLSIDFFFFFERERKTSICCSTHLRINRLLLVCALSRDRPLSGQYCNRLNYLARATSFSFTKLNSIPLSIHKCVQEATGWHCRELPNGERGRVQVGRERGRRGSCGSRKQRQRSQSPQTCPSEESGELQISGPRAHLPSTLPTVPALTVDTCPWEISKTVES